MESIAILTLVPSPFHELVLNVILSDDKVSERANLNKLQTNKWIDTTARGNTKKRLFMLAIIIDLNIQTPDAYYVLRGAFEVADLHVINIYADVSRFEFSQSPASKIIVLLMYIVPTLVYTFRLVFQISLNYSVFMNIVELMHLVAIYAYFIMSFVLYHMKYNNK